MVLTKLRTTPRVRRTILWMNVVWSSLPSQQTLFLFGMASFIMRVMAGQGHSRSANTSTSLQKAIPLRKQLPSHTGWASRRKVTRPPPSLVTGMTHLPRVEMIIRTIKITPDLLETETVQTKTNEETSFRNLKETGPMAWRRRRRQKLWRWGHFEGYANLRTG